MIGLPTSQRSISDLFFSSFAMAGCRPAPGNCLLAHNMLDGMLCYGNCYFRYSSNDNRRWRKKKFMSYDFGSKACQFVDASRGGLANRLRVGKLNASDLEDDRNYLEQDGVSPDFGLVLPASLSWLWSLSNSHDDQSLRVARRWMGVVFEMEGVIVESDDPELEPHAWFILCQEEGKQFPSHTVLKTTEGKKTEEAISQVLGWSEDPSELERLTTRKEEIYQRLRGGDFCLRQGTQEFLSELMDCGIPMALVSARPRNSLEYAIQNVGLEGYFSCVVGAEDFDRGKPDPEMFQRAVELLDLHPENCIVIGNSDASVEGAASAGMSSVVVASNKPLYEFKLASRVVRWLNELSVPELERRTNPIQRRARETHMEME